MKRSDKQMLEMLEKEMQKSIDSANIPLRLQKESMITMLKNAEKKESDFSDKTGTTAKKSNGNTVMLRRLMASAAMLALIVGVTLVLKTGDGVKVVKTDSFYEGYKSSAPVRNAESYEEVEKAVEEILGSKTESKPSEAKPTRNPENVTNGNAQVSNTVERVKDGLIEGYSEYVAIANRVVGSIKYEIEKSQSANEPGGVAVYGYNSFRRHKPREL